MANFKTLSRYATKEIDTTRDGQQFIVLRQPLNLEPSAGDTYITITQELVNRPDLLAYRAYGDRELWWAIYEFNNISDPLFELQTGQILRIPELSRVRAAITSVRNS